MAPLSALCLVAGDGIGVFDLQGIVIGVGSQFLHPLSLVAYLGIVFPYSPEEILLLLLG